MPGDPAMELWRATKRLHGSANGWKHCVYRQAGPLREPTSGPTCSCFWCRHVRRTHSLIPPWSRQASQGPDPSERVESERGRDLTGEGRTDEGTLPSNGVQLRRTHHLARPPSDRPREHREKTRAAISGSPRRKRHAPRADSEPRAETSPGGHGSDGPAQPTRPAEARGLETVRVPPGRVVLRATAPTGRTQRAPLAGRAVLRTAAL